MKIQSIEVYKCYLKLMQPLKISFHTFEYSENYIVKVASDSGITGWGEGAPFELVTGDSEDAVRGELEALSLKRGTEITEPAEFYGRNADSGG